MTERRSGARAMRAPDLPFEGDRLGIEIFFEVRVDAAHLARAVAAAGRHARFSLDAVTPPDKYDRDPLARCRLSFLGAPAAFAAAVDRLLADAAAIARWRFALRYGLAAPHAAL